MQARRNYIAPVWWLVVLSVIKVGIILYVFVLAGEYVGTERLLRSFLPLQWMRAASNIIFWSCVFAGHAFFAAAIAEAVKNRKNEKPAEPGFLESL